MHIRARRELTSSCLTYLQPVETPPSPSPSSSQSLHPALEEDLKYWMYRVPLQTMNNLE